MGNRKTNDPYGIRARYGDAVPAAYNASPAAGSSLSAADDPYGIRKRYVNPGRNAPSAMPAPAPAGALFSGASADYKSVLKHNVWNAADRILQKQAGEAAKAYAEDDSPGGWDAVARFAAELAVALEPQMAQHEEREVAGKKNPSLFAPDDVSVALETYDGQRRRDWANAQLATAAVTNTIMSQTILQQQMQAALQQQQVAAQKQALLGTDVEALRQSIDERETFIADNFEYSRENYVGGLSGAVPYLQDAISKLQAERAREHRSNSGYDGAGYDPMLTDADLNMLADTLRQAGMSEENIFYAFREIGEPVPSSVSAPDAEAQVERRANITSDKALLYDAQALQANHKYLQLANEADFAEYTEKGRQEYTKLYTPQDYWEYGTEAHMAGDSKVETAISVMTPEEQAVYYYLRGKYGADRGRQYVDDIHRIIEERSAEGKLERAQQRAEEYPFWASLESVLYAPIKGVGYIGAAIQHMNNEPINTNAGIMMPSRLQSTIRETVGEGMTPFGNFLYQTGMSIGDFVAVAPFGQASLALMGAGAATDTMLDALERGASDEDAFLAGTLAGAFEVVFEKFSLDGLIKMASSKQVKDVLWNMLKQAGVEASEEMATELANMVMDTALLGDISNYNLAVQAYMRQGMSEAAARRQANRDQAIQLALAGAGGLLSGGVLSSGAQAVSGMKILRTGSRLNDTGAAPGLIAAGQSFGPSSPAYRQAQKTQANPSNLNVGRQYYANMEAQNAQARMRLVGDMYSLGMDPGSVEAALLQVGPDVSKTMWRENKRGPSPGLDGNTPQHTSETAKRTGPHAESSETLYARKPSINSVPQNVQNDNDNLNYSHVTFDDVKAGRTHSIPKLGEQFALGDKHIGAGEFNIIAEMLADKGLTPKEKAEHADEMQVMMEYVLGMRAADTAPQWGVRGAQGHGIINQAKIGGAEYGGQEGALHAGVSEGILSFGAGQRSQPDIAGNRGAYAGQPQTQQGTQRGSRESDGRLLGGRGAIEAAARRNRGLASTERAQQSIQRHADTVERAMGIRPDVQIVTEVNPRVARGLDTLKGITGRDVFLYESNDNYGNGWTDENGIFIRINGENIAFAYGHEVGHADDVVYDAGMTVVSQLPDEKLQSYEMYRSAHISTPDDADVSRELVADMFGKFMDAVLGDAYADITFGLTEGDIHQFYLAFSDALAAPDLQENTADAMTASFVNGTIADPEYSRVGDIGKGYSYQELISKPDMQIVHMDTSLPINTNGELDRKALIQSVLQTMNERNGSHYVYNNDIGGEITVNRRGLSHSLRRGQVNETAIATKNVRGLLENAIVINRLIPRQNIEAAYVMLGMGTDDTGTPYIVRFVVNRKYGGLEVGSIDVLYSINAKREPGAFYSLGSEQNAPAPSGSTISISDFLNTVKNSYPDVLSKSVLTHYGMSRSHAGLSDQVQYSRIDSGSAANPLADSATIEDAKRRRVKKQEAEKDSRKRANLNPEYSRISPLSSTLTYSYLVNQPDMQVVQMQPGNPRLNEGFRQDVVDAGMENARNKGNPKNNERVFVRNRYSGTDIQIDPVGIRHGLYGTTDRMRRNSKIGEIIGDAVENAITVNELQPRQHAVRSYLMVGMANDATANYPYAIVVNENVEGQRAVERYGAVLGDEIEYLYAVNAKKEPVFHRNGGLSGARTPAGSFSTISIADLLDTIKDNFPDGLSQDVLNHFGITRPAGGTFSDSAMYSRIQFDGGHGNALPEIKQKEDGTYYAALTIGGETISLEDRYKAGLEEEIQRMRQEHLYRNASEIVGNMREAAELFRSGISVGDYYVSGSYNEEVAKQLRGMYLRNGIQSDGVLSRRALPGTNGASKAGYDAGEFNIIAEMLADKGLTPKEKAEKVDELLIMMEYMLGIR